MDVRAFANCTLNLFRPTLGDIDCRDNAIERPLVLTSGDLHDGGEESLGIEEPRNPCDLWRVEVCGPLGELLVAIEEIQEPQRKRSQRWPSKNFPSSWHAVGKQGIHQVFHWLRDREVATEAGVKLSKRSPYLENKVVHALALLEEEGDVGSALFSSFLNLYHEKELGELLKDVVELLLDTLPHRHAPVTTTTTRLQLRDGVEQVVRLPSHEVDLRVGVQTVGGRCLALEILGDVLKIFLVREVWRSRETWKKLDAFE
mmetsp:Transcript_19075/g.57600  ORF Transcript_19075/g.57600 Transcript_19075/m.57600 type:complete len:258 (-) Transcript_19075:6872-7645(-)